MSQTQHDAEPPSSPKSQTEALAPPPLLLPAFEPASSSPGLPRPTKRKYDESSCIEAETSKHSPSPLPTSSTNLIHSSSPHRPRTRPAVERTFSNLSERVPLGTVPSLELPLDGKPVSLGRSSNASQHQLSANRLISRVHAKAAYRPADANHEHGFIFVECLGWNGLKIHCRGSVYELGKGDIFSSDKPQAELLLDVQDARVLLRWPPMTIKESMSAFPDEVLEEAGTPRRNAISEQDGIASSPPQLQGAPESPVSPSPRARPDLTASSTFLGLPRDSEPDVPAVQVYEDHSCAEDNIQPSSIRRPNPSPPAQVHSSRSSSSLSSVEDFSDREEENDPIVHSFGPFGENLLPRMASFQAISPERRKEPLKNSVSPKQHQQHRSRLSPHPHRALRTHPNLSPIRNHVINQLAYSRLHSVPLGTIMSHLPDALTFGNAINFDLTETCNARDQHESKPTFTHADLKDLLEETACIGEIQREGKDAAGKALEDEFYYVPELDTDEARKNAVEHSLGKPGLRAVRKQHKVCRIS